MKIGIFNPYFDDLGGGEKYMSTIAECLSQKHDVTVFWDKKEDVEELLQRFSLDLSRVAFAKNIFSKDFSLFKRLLATRAYDAIIVLSDGSIPLVLSKKLFIHFQQPISLRLTIKDRLKLGRVSAIFCNSQYTKLFIDKGLGVDSHVIYPPVDLHVRRAKKENIILTVGRLRVKDTTTSGKPIGDYKKQSVMIDVFRQMVREGLRGWRFVLAISVHSKEKKILTEMKEEARDLPIDFLINKSNKELWDIYNRAKIYWHAAGFGEDLEKNPERAEHFGISTVEAMGAGAVPIVINAGGQREIINNEEDGFLWNHTSELKEKTIFLTKNEKKRIELAKKAQERSKIFSKEHFYKQMYELLET